MTIAFEIPTVETDRLRPRLPQMSDLDAFAAFRSSPRSSFVGGPFTRTESFRDLAVLIGQWHLRGYGRWMITDKSSGKPLGTTGVYHPEDWPERELAWSLFDAAEGRGIAFEAAMAARDFAYRVFGWSSIISCVDPANTRSVALAERMGATFERIFTHPSFGEMHVWRHPGPEGDAQ